MQGPVEGAAVAHVGLFAVVYGETARTEGGDKFVRVLGLADGAVVFTLGENGICGEVNNIALDDLNCCLVYRYVPCLLPKFVAMPLYPASDRPLQ